MEPSSGLKIGHPADTGSSLEGASERIPSSSTGPHTWYVCSHARPTHCNFCREKLSGMAWHGLSCEVCRMKAHKRCASKMTKSCKWKFETCLPCEVKIADANGVLQMPHQWVEGNLPIGCRCFVCERTCGSVLKLQDWRCIWCGSYAHEQCKLSAPKVCTLGSIRLSVLPPVAVKSINRNGECDVRWECIGGDYGAGSPLLVLVNSKSGENQGMRILAKFRRLLNPAQVIDIITDGPHTGLKYFCQFDSFRVLVCGGDGSVGWVLSAVDSLGLLSKCQIGILPLGTGNDLARVLGWGRAFDDESQLLHIIQKFERAHTRMLDRWSIMTSSADTSYAMLKKESVFDIEKHESCINELLSGIGSADDDSAIFCATRVLHETVREFIILVKQALAEAEREREGNGKNDITGDQNEIHLSKLEHVLRSWETSPLHSNENREIFNEQASIDSGISSASSKAKSQRELVLKRENSLKKAVRQLTEHAKAFAFKMKENRDSVLAKREYFRKKRSKTAPGVAKKSGLNGGNSGGGSLMSLHAQMPFTTFPGIADFSFGDIYSLCASPLSTVPPVVPKLSVPRTPRDARKCSAPHIPTRLDLPCIGDVEPPTPNRTPTAVEFPKNFRPKWLDTESSVEEAEDLLEPGPRLGNMPRSLSDSINAGKCPSPSVSFSDLQLSPIDASSENCFFFDAKTMKKKPYDNMKSRSDSSIFQRSAGPEYSIPKAAFLPNNAVKDSSVPSSPTKKGIFVEQKVMNNYFGIGLDAKIALEFHNKREELPDKARSRSKLFMWYGMLGGKELLLRTYRNLDQRIRLECDGQLMQLPSLQGIVILNIPSYSGGANFWGSRREASDCSFSAQSFDDRMLEVVALFGVIHVATSRVPRLPLQKHRIAQCRHVNIVIKGDEPIPVQVDGEPWLQPPGVIEIVYKNRAQMLVHNPVFEATLRTWQEQNRTMPTTPTAVVHPHFPAIDTPSLFVEAAARLTDLLDASQPDACILVSDESLAQSISEANCAITLALGCNCSDASDCRISEVVRTVRILVASLNATFFPQADAANGGNGSEWHSKLADAIASVTEDLEKMERPVVEVIQVAKDGNEGESSVSTSNAGDSIKSDENRIRPRVRSRVAQWFRSRWGRRRRRAASADAVITWNVEEVCTWINSMGFKDYNKIFRAHNITGKELLRLRVPDIKQLGLTNPAHLAQFKSAIDDLKRHVGSVCKSRTPNVEKESCSWSAKPNNNEASTSSF